jgi:hypothetical protein
MSVVSSTDVECFRRLANPEVVDVNGAGTSTRKIAQQMREAMEKAVATQISEDKDKESETSDNESERKTRTAPPPDATSRLAKAMQAQAAQVVAPEPPNPATPPKPPSPAAEKTGPSASVPSMLPVAAPLVVTRQPVKPIAASLPRQDTKQNPLREEKPDENKAEGSSSDEDEEESVTETKKDPAAIRLEKQGYLIELQALEARGVKLSRPFSMKDGLTELEFEVQKQNSNLNTVSAVANMKDMMKICFNGLEMCNLKFGPFLCMEGWAESITSDMKRFDSSLEKLYKRYWRKQQMSPVMELGMIILGSLAMHHFKTKLFGPVIRPASPPPPPPQQPSKVHADSTPPPPRLRKGTPSNLTSSSFPARAPAGSSSFPRAAAASSRPTLRPPSAMFGF